MTQPSPATASLIANLFSLEGRTVVVTGAGSGLGRAIAEGCAEAGASVVCAGRSEASRRVAAELADRGWCAVGVEADVTEEASVEALMREAEHRYGSIDVVFCNAGTSDHYKRADEMSLEEWHSVISVDLTGVFLCAKHAARRMIEQGRGKIVTVSSIWGQVGSDTVPIPAYAAAKGGVVNLTRELALEYARHGMTVNSLCPGFFNTNIGTDKEVVPGVIDALVEGALALSPLHRFADPSEIKGTAIYLASRASDLVNGHILAVDGGCLAR
jgi:NAD(P)-dependent dehydrogenase (short-subunit alcohol dehydrogenase family)